MSKQKASREPADTKPSLRVEFWPWRTYTVATVDVGYRDGAGIHRSRLCYLHLRLSRADLAGLTGDDVLRTLCLSLLRGVESRDPANRYSTGKVTTRPEAPAPLEGPQGEDHTQAALPGLEPTL